MIKIPDTTLCCIDCYNHELAIRAIVHCLQMCNFEKAIFLTNKEYDLENIDVITIPTISTKEQYSMFVIKELNKYIDTDFVLMIQYDGFIINPGSWTSEFQKYDYIGAKWWWYTDGYNIGNGGFSLRSKRLLQALMDESINASSVEYGEDTLICRTYRGLLENKYGIKFAPEFIADRFSFERSEPVSETFGFHGLYNMWRFIMPEYLEDFLKALFPQTLKSIEAIELGINYQELGRSKEAEIVYRKILEFYPDHQKAISLLKEIEQPAIKKNKTGRNVPCLCGSGKKYKKCCGNKDRDTEKDKKLKSYAKEDKGK